MCGACARAARGARDREACCQCSLSRRSTGLARSRRRRSRAHPRRLSLHERVAHVPRGGERAAASHTRSTRYAAHALRRAQCAVRAFLALAGACARTMRGALRARRRRHSRAALTSRLSSARLRACLCTPPPRRARARVATTALLRTRAALASSPSSRPRRIDGLSATALLVLHTSRVAADRTRAPCAVRVSRAPVFASYERGHARPHLCLYRVVEPLWSSLAVSAPRRAVCSRSGSRWALCARVSARLRGPHSAKTTRRTMTRAARLVERGNDASAPTARVGWGPSRRARL